jgi:toxin ParE1/3/4
VAYRLARTAEDQIDAILLQSARKHGIEAAARYRLLIRVSIEAIGDDPSRPGSRNIPRAPGIRAYAMSVIRLTIAAEQRVQSPRHLLVYRVAADDVVEVLGIVHDRMLLARAARRAVRDAGQP